MAKEIRSVKCHPDYESSEINFRQKFGWEFVSTQEIYNKDTHLESSVFSNSATSVTETTHYVKLTFQRQREEINSELLALEREFDNLYVPEEPKIYTCGQIFIGLMFTIPGIYMLIQNNRRSKEYEVECARYSAEFDALMARLDALQQ